MVFVGAFGSCLSFNEGLIEEKGMSPLKSSPFTYCCTIFAGRIDSFGSYVAICVPCYRFVLDMRGNVVAYWHPIMFVVHGPPSAHLLFIYASGTCTVSSDLPWFVVANEMQHAYSTLKVPVSWDILVVAIRRTIVGKA